MTRNDWKMRNSRDGITYCNGPKCYESITDKELKNGAREFYAFTLIDHGNRRIREMTLCVGCQVNLVNYLTAEPLLPNHPKPKAD